MADLIENHAKLHIAQDEDGLWMLSVEYVDGTMKLLAYQFPSPEHLIEDAQELTARRYPGATILVAEPLPSPPIAPVTFVLEQEHKVPIPRKVAPSRSLL